MKKVKSLSLLLVLWAFKLNVSAQDKIIKRSGDTLKVKIIRSAPDMVEFSYPNESVINSEYKNSILKIIYASGREEDCSSGKKLAVITGEQDWEKVEITTNPDDVKGLTKLGEVIGESSLGRLMPQATNEKNARKDLKKNAAKLGASIVLLQENKENWGVKITGIAYK